MSIDHVQDSFRQDLQDYIFEQTVGSWGLRMSIDHTEESFARDFLHTIQRRLLHVDITDSGDPLGTQKIVYF